MTAKPLESLMPGSDPQPPPNVPFGTCPRRTAWPLIVLSVLFVAWFVFLWYVALKYPAR